MKKSIKFILIIVEIISIILTLGSFIFSLFLKTNKKVFYFYNINIRYVGFIFIGLFFLIISVYITTVLIHETHKTTVIRESVKLKEILKLNQSVFFHDIEPEIEISIDCSSKQEYDRKKAHDILFFYISENRIYIESLIDQANHNRTQHDKYINTFNNILQHDSAADLLNYEKHKYFKVIEENMCLENKLETVTSPVFIVSKKYLSPKGRNYYHGQTDFSFSNVVDCLSRLNEKAEYQKTIKYQRSLMTTSLRYDVMKRDNFKCVICGATAHDGVRLHVDHILPISKGGKTEMSNLRTLCDMCNHGKAAKFDYEGLN